MNSRTKKTKVRSITRLLARGRACYEKADVIFSELAKAVPIGEAIETDDGKYAIVDNFAEKNSAYRVARVARLELKKLKAEKETAAHEDV